MAHPQPFSDTLAREMTPYSDDLDVRVTDSSLRDGSHAKRHQFTTEHVIDIVAALDEAGVPVIEVTHGDGLGGSSFNYGFSHTPELELISAAVKTAKQAKIAFLMLPGLGTKDDIRAAQDAGGSDLPHRHALHRGRRLRAALRAGPRARPGDRRLPDDEPLGVAGGARASRRRIMADAGCQCVYVVDSAGALIMEQTSDRVAALVAELGDDAQVGFHGHENLGLGVAQLGARLPRRRPPDGRLDPPLRRRRRQHPGRGLRRRRRQARHPDRRRRPEDHRRGRGRRAPGHGRRVPARPAGADHGLRRRLLQLPQARRPARRAVRRVRRRAADPGGRAQARRRPGGPAHRHRAGDRREREKRVEPTPTDTRRTVEVDGHELAYHDVGEGPPVVCCTARGPGVTGWANFGATRCPALSTAAALPRGRPARASARAAVPSGYDRNYLRIAAEAVGGLLDALGLEQVSAWSATRWAATSRVRFALDQPEAGRRGCCSTGRVAPARRSSARARRRASPG